LQLLYKYKKIYLKKKGEKKAVGPSVDDKYGP